MRFDIITLFPEMFTAFLESGVTRRAYASGQVAVHLWNPRDYAQGNYRRVDDRPFGGGPGMVMMAEPLQHCIDAIRAARAEAGEAQPAPVLLFSPIGTTLKHEVVAQWGERQGAILLCGRYEGIDQRFIDKHVTHQISLGDFVLSGGELAAMVMLDAIARLQPQVQNRAGEDLGVVKDLLATGPQTTLVLGYEVDGKELERMIPFVDAYIDKVDLAAQTIVADWQLDY